MTIEPGARSVTCLFVALIWVLAGGGGATARDASGPGSGESFWTIQVGAYRVAGNAEAARRILEERGYGARIVKSDVEGEHYFQVRVGRFSTREQARGQATRMVEKQAVENYLLLRESASPSDDPSLRSVETGGEDARRSPRTPAVRGEIGEDTIPPFGTTGDDQRVDPERARREAGSDSPDRLSLEQAYRIALKRNEQVQISREQLRQTLEDRRIAGAGLLPDLRLVTEAKRQKVNTSPGSPTTNEENVIGTLSLTQPLYHGGKLRAVQDAAEYRVRQQRDSFFRRRQQILLTVASRFYGVLLAQYQINIAENTLRRARRQLDQAQARFEVKAISRTPVLRARVQVSDAREQLERARNQYNVAREELAIELGLETPPDALRPPPDQVFEGKDIQTYFQRALSHRKDFQQARLAVREARERLDVEKADWLPKFDLEAEGSRFEEEVLGQEEDWTVSAVMTYPLYSGGQALAEIDRQKSVLRQSKQQRERLKRQVRLEVRRAYLNLRTQRRVIESLEDQVESARENYRQVSARFREGLANSVDVSDAITVLNEAENRLATARTQYQIDVLNLRLATGTFQQNLLEKGS